MKMPAKIYINTNMLNNDVDLAVEGDIEFYDNNTYIEYSEGDQTKTIIGINSELVSINKIGELNYTMILKKGESSVMELSTPFGKLNFNVIPKLVKYEFTKNSGEVNLRYTLSYGDEKVENSLSLNCEY